MNVIKKAKRLIVKYRRPKVFCIGHNKTGTTTMERVLRNLGYRLPRQALQEMLVVEESFHGNFGPLKSLCRKYDAFQDMPFSQGVAYANVDSMFPGSKFILTVRESGDWWESLARFHLAGILEKAGINKLSDFDELTFKNKSVYLHENYSYNLAKRHAASVVNHKLFHDWSLVYDKEHRIGIYEARNQEILKYFQDRPDQLLVIDVTKEKDTSIIVEFLDLPRKHVCGMPHANKSEV